MNTTITTAAGHGVRPGDAVRVGPRARWWVRLWRWLLRRRDPNVYTVTRVTETTMDVKR